MRCVHLAYRAALTFLLFCLAPHASAEPTAPAAPTDTGVVSLMPRDGDEFPNTIYRYRNKRGRLVFTNIWDQIPASQRAKAEKVDLSKVTLNEQVGAELDASMDHEFETLSRTPECKEVKERASHWLGPIWQDYGHLIVIGGIFLALLIATPYALRRIDAPTWSRTLTKSLMLLGFVGVFMHTSVRAGQTYDAMKRAAAPCMKETWAATASAPATDRRPSQAKLLMDLQTMIQHAQSQTDADRLRELDQLLSQ